MCPFRSSFSPIQYTHISGQENGFLLAQTKFIQIPGTYAMACQSQWKTVLHSKGDHCPRSIYLPSQRAYSKRKEFRANSFLLVLNPLKWDFFITKANLFLLRLSLWKGRGKCFNLECSVFTPSTHQIIHIIKWPSNFITDNIHSNQTNLNIQVYVYL